MLQLQQASRLRGRRGDRGVDPAGVRDWSVVGSVGASHYL